MRKLNLLTVICVLFFSLPFLNAQDVAICGIDNIGSDEFAFVALRDFEPSEKIYFTEARYSDFNNAFLIDEGHIEYTTDPLNGLKENSVISITIFTSSNVGTNSINGLNTGSAINVAGTGTFSLSITDEIYAYTASDSNSPWNSIIDVSCFLWTENGQIPTDQRLVNDYPDAIIVDNTGGATDGFAGNFKGPSRINTTREMLNDISQWNTSTGAIDLDLTPFSNQSLPVELLSFKGLKEGVANILNWSTASEQGNAYFMVERSSDGISFQTIGKVNGHGDSSEEKNYDFKHRNPLPSINYYRLKQVDFNGLFEYSGIIQLDNSRNESPIKVYPIPATDYITVDVPGNQDSSILEIFNINGNRVLSRTLNAGEKNSNLEISDFTNGTYIIQHKSTKGTFTKRIVKN